MKDDLAFKQSKRLGHTRQHFDIFNAMAEWAVSEAGGKEKVFGRKPGVAEFKPTDLSTETGRAVKGNLANIEEIKAFLEKVLPGYKNMVGQESKNIQSLLRGEIPDDVQQSIQRSGAFKSLQGGYGGSPMSRALVGRDIGRTSLDLMDRGGNAMERWMRTTQNSVAPFTITTPMQAAQTEKNNLYEQATKQFSLNVDAAPDPGAAGVFNLQTAMGAMAASWGMSSALQGQGTGGGAATAPASGGNRVVPASSTSYNYGPWDTGYRWGGG